jgi:hypothetical protein
VGRSANHEFRRPDGGRGDANHEFCRPDGGYITPAKGAQLCVMLDATYMYLLFNVCVHNTACVHIGVMLAATCRDLLFNVHSTACVHGAIRKGSGSILTPIAYVG